MAWVVDAPHLKEKPLNSHQALSSKISFSYQLATSITEIPSFCPFPVPQEMVSYELQHWLPWLQRTERGE